MYAARWFPFHDYAADRATTDITITLPAVFRSSATAMRPLRRRAENIASSALNPDLSAISHTANTQTKLCVSAIMNFSFTRKSPTIADCRLTAKLSEKRCNFTRKNTARRKRANVLSIAQIDDDSLDFYSAQGMIFIADRLFRAIARNHAGTPSARSRFSMVGLDRRLEIF